MPVIKVDLNDLVLDTFRNIFVEIVDCAISEAVLKGGRNTTKSQMTTEAIITGVMKYKQSAVALIKHTNKIEKTLVSTFRSSINYMNLNKYWRLRKAPFEYVLLTERKDPKGRLILDKYGQIQMVETDVSICFAGCDDPEGLKSFKPRTGAFRYIWFEELTNFRNEKEVNTITQTMGRGEGRHCVIKSYNPPERASHWVNKLYNVQIGKILGHTNNTHYEEFEFEVEPGVIKTSVRAVHHSTYLDVIAAGKASWLGDEFIADAQKSKLGNDRYYRNNYLGEVVETEASVFPNIREWDGDISKIDAKTIYRGWDWGNGGPDTCMFGAWVYDKKNKSIYAIQEFGKPKMTLDQVAFEMKHNNPHNFPIKGDGAVPLLNSELTNRGINISNVKKGPDSVLAGIKWMQNLNNIYICKDKTPKHYKEFVEYEYETDRDGSITSKLPDKNNHSIDAARYALADEIRYDI